MVIDRRKNAGRVRRVKKLLIMIGILCISMRFFMIDGNAATVNASESGKKAPIVLADKVYKVKVKKQSGMVVFKAPYTQKYCLNIYSPKWKKKKGEALLCMVIDQNSANKIKKNTDSFYYKDWSWIWHKSKDWYWSSKDFVCVGDSTYCKKNKKYYTKNQGEIKLEAGHTYLIYVVGSSKNFEYKLDVWSDYTD